MSPYPWRALVVAEQILQTQVFESLAAAGFSIEVVNNEKDAVGVLRERQFDIVILHVVIPGRRGIRLCRRLRSFAGDAGIVVLRTGGAAEDDILAMDAGADDCLAEPLRFREFVARVGAVLRTRRLQPVENSSLLRAGDLELDLVERQLWKGRRQVCLSTIEFDLLSFLMRNREVPLTYMRLYRGVWSAELKCDRRSVRACIRFLRGRIEDDPSNPAYILTEPWVGYRFHDPGRYST